VIGGADNSTPAGDVAYMNVNIKDVNSGASRAADGGYELGTGNETEVKSAKFMFFDAQGKYMNIQANKWEEGGYGNEGDNVEHFGANTIVLRGLKGTDSYPSYMLVVLNYASFEPEATLEATSKKLVGLRNTDGTFYMSTTSYYGAEATHYAPNFYYATKLTNEDFMVEPAANNKSNVDVYVERLAAKVTFAAKDGFEAEKITTAEGEVEAFPLNITIGGTDNDDNGGLVEGDNKVYVRILGWGLNATPTQSYISKQLAADWKADNALWANWQNPADFRSFWAQSVVYGQDITADNVVYTDYANLGLGLGEPAYTYEHTNSVDKIKKEDGKFDQSKVTSILVKAQVCNNKGEGLDLVQIYGINYTYDGFKGLVLSNMATLDNHMNYYYVADSTEEPVLDADGNQVYKQYEADDAEGHKKGDFVLDPEGNKIPLMQTVNTYAQFSDKQLTIVSAEGQGTGAVTLEANLDGITEIY
ncbi:MAG: hypothetical protein K2M68_05360, partial [Muribaculaceae bacterium]|nr:hypothetical protein [Muribaculaceae bacterium]